MNCEDSKNLITVSVYGILTPFEFSQLETHLRDCPGCAQIFEKTIKMNDLNIEKKDMHMPDKEKSWQIISAKVGKNKKRWPEYFAPRRPAFQFSLAILILIVGFAGGFLIQSTSQNGGEITAIRQEVLQIREITAASLLRQESLNIKLQEMSASSRLGQPSDTSLTGFLRRLAGEAGISTGQISTDDPLLSLRNPAAGKSFIQSLSEQTSPLVEIALAFTRYIQQ